MAPSRLFFSLPPYFVFQFPRWLVIVADVKCDEPEAELIEMDTMKIQHRRNFYSFFFMSDMDINPMYEASKNSFPSRS